MENNYSANTAVIVKILGVISLLISLKTLSLDIQHIKFNPTFHFPLLPVDINYPTFILIHILMITGAILLISSKKTAIGSICLSIGHIVLLAYDPLVYTDAQYMLLWLSIICLPFFSNKILLIRSLYITSLCYQAINRVFSTQWTTGQTLISYKNVFYNGHSLFDSVLSNIVMQNILIWIIPLVQLSALTLLISSLKKKNILLTLAGYHIIMFILFCVFHKDPYIQYSQFMSGILLIAWIPPHQLKSWIQKKILLDSTDIPVKNYQQDYLSTKKKWISITILGLVILQILIPASVYLQKNDLNWTERGAWASWRMKVNATDVKCIIAVRNPITNQIRFHHPPQELNKQASAYQFTPYAIWHYTQFLKKKYTEAGLSNVEIYVKLQKSINGSPYYDLIDPRINMANQEYNFVKENTWILQKPQ